MSEHFNYSFSPEVFLNRRIKQYSIVIFLPPPLEEIVSRFRERYDPDCSLIAAHVTLAFPFQTQKSLDEVAEIVTQETSRFRDLKVQFEDTVGDFYPDYPIIFWAVRHSEQLHELVLCLHAQLGIPLPVKKFFPHVAVAREISNHRVIFVKEKIVPYLPSEEFKPRALDLIAPIADQHWVSVRTFPLQGD